MPPSRRRFLKATGVTGAVFLAGCSDTVDEGDDSSGDDTGGGDGNSGDDSTDGDTNGEPGTEDEIVIGFLHPSTGGYSVLGEPQRAGGELAVRMLNENGGINGREVVGIHEDTAGDPSTARQRAERLLDEEDADILTGLAVSSAGLAVQELAADREVVFANQTGADSATRSDCNRYSFRYELRSDQEALPLSGWATENLGTDIWFHHADYAYGTDFRSGWEEALNTFDIDYNVVGDTASELGASDFSSYITSIQNADPDFVALGLAGGDLVTFSEQALSYALGDSVDVVTGTSDFMASRMGSPEGALGQYSIVRYNEGRDSDLNREFVNAYVDEFDAIPHNHAESQWSMVTQVLGPAIAEADSTAPDDLIPVLEGFEFESPMGTCRIRECDHQMARDVQICQVVGNKEYDWVPDNDFPSLEVIDTIPVDDAITGCADSGCTL